MAASLTDRQQEVLNCIKDFIIENGISPTRAEIADIMGFQSRNAATDHLRALQKKGFIRIHSDLSRGIQILADDEFEPYQRLETELVPIIGSVAAGVPIEAIENIENRVPVPLELFRTRPTYLLRVRGDSMQDAGILDGDLIAVKKAQTAEAGEIVVARIDDEVTVKELKFRRNKPVLIPHNDAYEPIVVAPDELQIEGVFVGLIRG